MGYKAWMSRSRFRTKNWKRRSDGMGGYWSFKDVLGGELVHEKGSKYVRTGFGFKF